MQRPGRFEHSRFLGDKRTQQVYDLDAVDDDTTVALVEALAEGPDALSFSPDTLAEARNRGYRLAD